MEKLLFITTRSELKQLLAEIMGELNQDSPPEPDITERLTRREAAKFMGVSYQSMYNYLRKGWVKEHGVGQKKFFLRSELKRVILNHNL